MQVDMQIGKEVVAIFDRVFNTNGARRAPKMGIKLKIQVSWY